MKTAQGWSVVAPDKFICATRDSGYKSTSSALSELVDNAIQAGARNIDIQVEESNSVKQIELIVTDDGCGMDPFTLRQALRFGGSSRFNDRSGLGRFGMGLPNSSLSQAKRVTVTSWTDLPAKTGSKPNVLGSGAYLQTFLDVDEIADGRMREVPAPRSVPKPPSTRGKRSGTVVHWTDCDRLDFRRVSTICRHLDKELSRRFRFFLDQRTRIRVNNRPIRPFDPLFLTGDAGHRAIQYGDDILYTISSKPDDPKAPTGIVRVRFSELPVAKWARLSNEEKRERGITKNAGASVVRANREVDYGWFFFGAKRKENYDDWWRCEVQFEPILDEAFGLTHTKQQIKPQQFLLETLVPDLEATARVLSARARKAHEEISERRAAKRSEVLASARSAFLEPLRNVRASSSTTGLRYEIKIAPLEQGCFYAFKRRHDAFVLTLDPDHAFYRELYAPLRHSHEESAIQTLVELLLFSAVRTEATMSAADQTVVAQFRGTWGKTLETLLAG